MAVESHRSGGGNYLTRSPNPSGLYDVLELILDKGLVIDIFVRVSIIGIEILTIDARIVIASVDTYLRFAEAVNRLDLTETGGRDLGEVVGGLHQGAARTKTKGALEGAKDSIKDVFSSDDDEEETEEAGTRQPKRRRQAQEADDE